MPRSASSPRHSRFCRSGNVGTPEGGPVTPTGPPSGPYCSKPTARGASCGSKPTWHAGHLTLAQRPDRRRTARVELHAATTAASVDRLDHHDSVARIDELLGYDVKLLPHVANLFVEAVQPIDARRADLRLSGHLSPIVAALESVVQLMFCSRRDNVAAGPAGTSARAAGGRPHPLCGRAPTASRARPRGRRPRARARGSRQLRECPVHPRWPPHPGSSTAR